MQVLEFDNQVLNKLLKNKIPGADVGPAAVLVILEILNGEEYTPYYVPGYMTTHRSMSDILMAGEKQYGWAGRLGYKGFKNELELNPGGGTLPGYFIKRNHEFKEKIGIALTELKRPDIQVVWARS